MTNLVKYENRDGDEMFLNVVDGKIVNGRFDSIQGEIISAEDIEFNQGWLDDGILTVAV